MKAPSFICNTAKALLYRGKNQTPNRRRAYNAIKVARWSGHKEVAEKLGFYRCNDTSISINRLTGLPEISIDYRNMANPAAVALSFAPNCNTGTTRAAKTTTLGIPYYVQMNLGLDEATSLGFCCYQEQYGKNYNNIADKGAFDIKGWAGWESADRVYADFSEQFPAVLDYINNTLLSLYGAAAGVNPISGAGGVRTITVTGTAPNPWNTAFPEEIALLRAMSSGYCGQYIILADPRGKLAKYIAAQQWACCSAGGFNTGMAYTSIADNITVVYDMGVGTVYGVDAAFIFEEGSVAWTEYSEVYLRYKNGVPTGGDYTYGYATTPELQCGDKGDSIIMDMRAIVKECTGTNFPSYTFNFWKRFGLYRNPIDFYGEAGAPLYGVTGVYRYLIN